MLKKHPTCRWRSEKVKSRKYFILDEEMQGSGINLIITTKSI